MALPWFRLYSEFQHDPKVQIMPEHMQRRLVMLLCARCTGDVLTDKVVGFQWRLTASEVQETKSLFVEHGFIDETWKVLNWDKRQYLSDSSKERTRQYRERKFGDRVVTLPNRHSDVPRTDTDAEQIQNNAPSKRYF